MAASDAPETLAAKRRRRAFTLGSSLRLLRRLRGKTLPDRFRPELAAGKRVVRGDGDVDAALIEAAALDVLVHDVRDGHACIEVVDDHRAARPAPERDAATSVPLSIDRVHGWVAEPVAHTPAQREAGDHVGTLGLLLEHALATFLRQQPHAAHLAAARDHGLDRGDAARVAVAVAAAELA